MKDVKNYEMFKGLQMPLTFMSFKGKYIYYGFASLAIGLVVCVLVILIVGNNIIGGLAWIGSTLACFGYTAIQQKKGLYRKKKKTGVFTVKSKYIFNNERKENQ